MKKIFSLLILLPILLAGAWSCGDRELYPLESQSISPSKKVAIQDIACSSVTWDCEAMDWHLPADSVWTVVYGDYTFLFNTVGRGAVTYHFNDDGSEDYRDIYERDAEDPEYLKAFLQVSDNQCVVYSDVFVDSLTVRVFRGDVSRGPYGRYWLKHPETSYRYRITKRFYRHGTDELFPEQNILWYVDFKDSNNRLKPRPDGLTRIDRPPWEKYKLFYLPFNFSSTALDTVFFIRLDDRFFMEFSLDIVDMDAPCSFPLESEEVDDMEEIAIQDQEETLGSSSQGSMSSVVVRSSSTIRHLVPETVTGPPPPSGPRFKCGDDCDLNTWQDTGGWECVGNTIDSGYLYHSSCGHFNGCFAPNMWGMGIFPRHE